MDFDNYYSSYVRELEPDNAKKAEAWSIAIGLQEVDGLKPSKYLLDLAKEHIDGNITIDEVKDNISRYYEENDKRKLDECKEADIVSSRITDLLEHSGFSFSTIELSNIHKELFKDIYDSEYRTYNISKKEWVLDDDTVIYSSYNMIKDTLEYDFKEEKNFSYKGLSTDELINHICGFISDIWQVHPFCEGNTRTVAVFLIKYLRTFGFYVDNEPFRKNSWYFRNALVRANYRNHDKNVYEDLSYLKMFIYNLLTDSNYELKNRDMHIGNISKDEYTYEERMIISMIKNNSSIRQEEIASKLNKSIRTIKNYMGEMQKKGIIERINGKNNGEWIIKVKD